MTAKKKKNCWEFMLCGRQTGGHNAAELGVCPAAADASFNGFNEGINGGRVCWLVAGTFCGGKQQGTFSKKEITCQNCAFYRKVFAQEEGFSLSSGSIQIYALTHIGLIRKTNEDRYLTRKMSDDSMLLCVADGLGGQTAGDYAAEIMLGKLASLKNIAVGEEFSTLSKMMEETDQFLIDEGERLPELEGMGTTLLAVLLRDNIAYWILSGDCRLNLLRDGEFIQITKDQNLARYLVEEGEILLEEVPDHYSRNVLDQCIGCGICEPETGQLEFIPGDLLIISSDGLHNQISHEIMQKYLKKKNSLAQKADSLIKNALQVGGKDNITVLLASFEIVKEK